MFWCCHKIFMPRTKRKTIGGYFYHVMNRANGRLRIFQKEGDYIAFENVLAEGQVRTGMRICGYCIMGNHWHLLLWPENDGDLSDFMHWITLTHASRYCQSPIFWASHKCNNLRSHTFT